MPRHTVEPGCNARVPPTGTPLNLTDRNLPADPPRPAANCLKAAAFRPSQPSPDPCTRPAASRTHLYTDQDEPYWFLDAVRQVAWDRRLQPEPLVERVLPAWADGRFGEFRDLWLCDLQDEFAVTVALGYGGDAGGLNVKLVPHGYTYVTYRQFLGGPTDHDRHGRAIRRHLNLVQDVGAARRQRQRFDRAVGRPFPTHKGNCLLPEDLAGRDPRDIRLDQHADLQWHGHAADALRHDLVTRLLFDPERPMRFHELLPSELPGADGVTITKLEIFRDVWTQDADW